MFAKNVLNDTFFDRNVSINNNIMRTFCIYEIRQWILISVFPHIAKSLRIYNFFFCYRFWIIDSVCFRNYTIRSLIVNRFHVDSNYVSACICVYKINYCQLQQIRYVTLRTRMQTTTNQWVNNVSQLYKKMFIKYKTDVSRYYF